MDWGKENIQDFKELMNPKFEVKIVFKDSKKITAGPESERGL